MEKHDTSKYRLVWIWRYHPINFQNTPPRIRTFVQHGIIVRTRNVWHARALAVRIPRTVPSVPFCFVVRRRSSDGAGRKASGASAADRKIIAARPGPARDAETAWRRTPRVETPCESGTGGGPNDDEQTKVSRCDPLCLCSHFGRGSSRRGTGKSRHGPRRPHTVRDTSSVKSRRNSRSAETENTSQSPATAYGQRDDREQRFDATTDLVLRENEMTRDETDRE